MKKDFLNLLSNVKTGKISSGLGIAGFILIVAKLLGYNVSQLVGMSDEQVILYFGITLQSVLLLIGKDPEELKALVKNLFKRKEKKQ